MFVWKWIWLQPESSLCGNNYFFIIYTLAKECMLQLEQHINIFNASLRLVRLWTQNDYHPFMRQATTFQSRNSDDLGEDKRLAFWISLTDRGIWFWLPCAVNLCLEHKQFFMLNDMIWNIHFTTEWKSFSWLISIPLFRVTIFLINLMIHTEYI